MRAGDGDICQVAVKPKLGTVTYFSIAVVE